MEEGRDDEEKKRSHLELAKVSPAFSLKLLGTNSMYSS